MQTTCSTYIVHCLRTIILCNELTVCPTEVEFSRGQLVSMLTILLETETELATHSLGDSLRHLTLALCRLPLFHEAAMTPAALKGDEKISVKMLDQALMESEVGTVHEHSLMCRSLYFPFVQILVQFMQRCNFAGWLNRLQFEERWMQLLGVVNQPPPQEGEFPEEYHAYTLNVCAGQIIMSINFKL